MEGSCVSTEEADSSSHPHIQDSTMLMCQEKSRLGQNDLLDDVKCVLLKWMLSKKSKRAHM